MISIEDASDEGYHCRLFLVEVVGYEVVEFDVVEFDVVKVVKICEGSLGTFFSFLSKFSRPESFRRVFQRNKDSLGTFVSFLMKTSRSISYRSP